MDALPRITVITPSFNQGDFIEETINSVLDQKYPNLEYIVMDGGSTDRTLHLLKKYEGRLRWWSERDRGQSHAINKGLKLATGRIVAFLNSDDQYEPEALYKVADFFAIHPKAHWLTGKCRTVDAEGNEIRRAITMYKNAWLRLCRYHVLFVLNYISQPATFWSRHAVEQVGQFDESLRYAMDYDYSLRVGQLFKLHILNEYLARFRIHPTSKAGASAHAQFDSEFEIAERYAKSAMLRRLHAFHISLIVSIYSALAVSGVHRADPETLLTERQADLGLQHQHE